MHCRLMRTHRQIVSEAGATQIASQRGVSIHTVRAWMRRDSIPSEHWRDLANQGQATLEELAAAAAQKLQQAAA